MSFKKVAMPLIVVVSAAIIFLELHRDKPIDSATELLSTEITTSEADLFQVKEQQSTQPTVKPIAKNTPKEQEITVCKNTQHKPALENLNMEDTKLRQIITKTETIDSEFTILVTDINNSSQETINKMVQLGDKYPDSSLIPYQILNFCTDANNKCAQQLVESAVQKLPDNSAAWLLKAIYHSANQQPQAAEAAIIEVSKAPYFNEYWSNYSDAVSIAYQQAGSSNNDMLNEIVNARIFAITLPSYRPLIKLCEQPSTNDTALSEACLMSGQLLSQNSTTVLSQFIGNVIQQKVLEKQDNTEQLQNVIDQHNAIKVILKQQAKASELIWRNKKLRDEWQLEMIQYGEVKASEFAIKEAIRISNDPNIDECLVVN